MKALLTHPGTKSKLLWNIFKEKYKRSFTTCKLDKNTFLCAFVYSIFHKMNQNSNSSQPQLKIGLVIVICLMHKCVLLVRYFFHWKGTNQPEPIFFPSSWKRNHFCPWTWICSDQNHQDSTSKSLQYTYFITIYIIWDNVSHRIATLIIIYVLTRSLWEKII